MSVKKIVNAIKVKRVLSMDPSSNSLAWVIFDHTTNGISMVACGKINFRETKEISLKFKTINKELKEIHKQYGAEIAVISGMELAEKNLHLAENRWLDIKNGDASPKAKMSKGVTSIKQQLGEVEKFVNWYSKIKNENGVKRDDYYKRTHKSLHKIKERLMNLSEKIRTL